MDIEDSQAPSEPRQSSLAMRNMFSSVARSYDLANRVMSLGRDLFWRRALARRIKILGGGGRLLDLASGTGDQIVAAKECWPGLSVTGLDLSTAMMDMAAPKLATLSPPRPEMVVGDALALPFPDHSFDSVSVAFGLRNIPARPEVYREVHRVLKPGGRFLVLEMFHDRESPWAPVVDLYLRKVVPVLGGRLVSREREAYRYLISSILAFPRPETLAREMAEAGFTGLMGRTYTFQTVMLLWGDKPGAGPGPEYHAACPG